MRGGVVLSSFLLLNGCAFPNAVQHLGVEYNTAVAGMANELTLLNILRAKEDLPLHYTSVGRLTGSLTVKGTGNINVPIRGASTVDTRTTQTTASATPSTITTVQEAVTEGLEVFTPTIGGEVSSGPNFDIAIYDTQKFYQGILSAVPFPTIESYINQGFSDQLLMRLLIERIAFKRTLPDGKETVVVWRNAPAGPDAKTFADGIACYNLAGRTIQKKPTPLAPVSRLNRNAQGKPSELKLEELALLDGKTFDLSGPITADPSKDQGVTVQRLSAEKRVADLSLKSGCNPYPASPPPDPIYVGNYKALLLGPDGKSGVEVPVEPEITFRSAESVIRFVGRYLQAYEDDPRSTPPLDGGPLFSVRAGRVADALVSSELLGRRYSIPDDANRRRNMQVISLIQQLVNLHKESSDRPVTVPVQVVGGT